VSEEPSEEELDLEPLGTRSPDRASGPEDRENDEDGDEDAAEEEASEDAAAEEGEEEARNPTSGEEEGDEEGDKQEPSTESDSSGAASRWSSRRLVVLAACCVVLTVGVISIAFSLVDSPAARISRQAKADRQRAVALAKPVVSKPKATAPVGITVPWDPTLPDQVATIGIPALRIVAPVIPEGTSKGYLTIPADVHHVGWDDQTAPAGQDGVTLLAGHVNWVGQGEGALGQIGQLVPGDKIILNWSGHQTTWIVEKKPTLSPNTEVHPSLFSQSGPPRLALVTCGGPFTETAEGGSYADNVIVWARPA